MDKINADASLEDKKASLLAQLPLARGRRFSDTWLAFNTLIDEGMLQRLELFPVDSMKIREKIRTAIIARLKELEPYKNLIKESTKHTLCPHYGASHLKATWGTCNVIWYWAGDKSTDFNHYTKRSLLAIIAAKIYAQWLRAPQTNWPELESSTEKLIDHVMKIPRLKSKVTGLFSSLFKRDG